jgi:hypothetical protein
MPQSYVNLLNNIIFTTNDRAAALSVGLVILCDS